MSQSHSYYCRKPTLSRNRCHDRNPPLRVYTETYLCSNGTCFWHYRLHQMRCTFQRCFMFSIMRVSAEELVHTHNRGDSPSIVALIVATVA